MPDPATTPLPTPLHLRTLGAVELRAEGVTTPLLGMGKPLALLIYLSAAPGRAATRSQLISLLWADLEPEGAKHAVRQAIWYIRRKVGADIVIAAGESLRLHADVEVDRDTLLGASQRSDHTSVVDLYSGSYVPDFASPGGSGFEDWCSLERRRLRQVFQHSAESLVASWVAHGRSRVAIDLTRRLRDEDLFDERAWRLLLEVCASAGDTLASRAEAEALEQLAERERMELEPATRALLRLIKSPEATLGTTGETHEGPLQSPTLVGREHVFSQLLSAWESVRGTNGAMQRVHITARAGLGKSRLLRDLQSRLRAMRAKVILVGGQYGARDVVFGLASELAAALAALPGRRAISPASASTLVALNPSISTYFEVTPRVASGENPMRARTLAMRELAAAVSFENPIALLIDDLHWADDESLALLSAFADGARESRILFVTTGRREARQAEVAATSDTQQLSLEPLNQQQIEELVLSIASLPNAAWGSELTHELWRVSRGSPLLALETLQLLDDRGVLRRVSGQWASDTPDTLLAELRAGDALRGRLEELERRERWILTLLAVAGSNVDGATLRDATEGDHDDFDARIRQLESRGFVVRAGDAWQIAHDELLDEVLRVATADGTARASARLVEAMLAQPAWDERRARRASQLLRAAGSDAMRRDVFRRFARQRYATGDRRSLRAMAADLLGAGAHDEAVRMLVRGAPLSWRLGLVSPARVAAAVAGGAALFVAAIVLPFKGPTPAPADAVLGFAVADSAGHVSFEQVELRVDGWDVLKPLQLTPNTEFPEFDVISTSALDFSRRRRDGLLVSSQAVEDSGVIDLFLHERGKAPRRVASAPGDDNLPRFSPDGKYVAFTTARWDSLSHYDLALYDVEGDSVVQLTHTPGTDDTPVWSPSGTRIAFIRANWGNGPNEFCIIVVSTRASECRPVKDDEPPVPLGWIDEDRLLVLSQHDEASRLLALQWSTNESVVVREGVMQEIRLSPDARWAYCMCQIKADGAVRPAVFPLQAASLVRAIALPGGAMGGQRNPRLCPYWISSKASTEAARLTIRAPKRAPSLVPTRLRATLTDQRGNEIPYAGSIRWSVADTSGATIDSVTGTIVLSGRSPSVLVIARSGLIARDSTILRLTPHANVATFSEEWRDSLMPGWIAFGKPVPSVMRAPDGSSALRNNGEGSFASGVVAERTFDPTNGVAIEARISGRVSLRQWQSIAVDLLDAVDLSLYRASRGHNVNPSADLMHEACAFTWPVERRTGGNMRGSLSGGSRVKLDSLPRALSSGDWHRLRLQLLPDARCALAIDGVPLVITRQLQNAPLRVWLAIYGNTYATDFLVGAVQVFEGVPNDIDWTKAKIAQ